jgi:hypothetical protein
MSTLCTSKSRTFLLTLLFTWWATECPGDYKYYSLRNNDGSANGAGNTFGRESCERNWFVKMKHCGLENPGPCERFNVDQTSMS